MGNLGLAMTVMSLLFVKVTFAQTNPEEFGPDCPPETEAVITYSPESIYSSNPLIKIAFKSTKIQNQELLTEGYFYPAFVEKSPSGDSANPLPQKAGDDVKVTLLGPDYKTRVDEKVVTLGKVLALKSAEPGLCLALSKEVFVLETREKERDCGFIPLLCGIRNFNRIMIGSEENVNYFQRSTNSVGQE
jgi:hypothetical protein